MTGDLIENSTVTMQKPEPRTEEPEPKIPDQDNHTSESNLSKEQEEELIEDSKRPDRYDDGEKEDIPQDQEVNDEYEIDDDEENGVEENMKENAYQEHQCNICEKTFKEKRRLVDHMTDVHSGRKDCSQCTESFSNKRNLNRHIREVHRRHGEDTMCTKCGKMMPCKESLKNHEVKCHVETIKVKVKLKFPVIIAI